MKQVYYVEKVWLREPRSVELILKEQNLELLCSLDSDNIIARRVGEAGPIFFLLHVSWGEHEKVEKYKLFLVDIFSMAGEEEPNPYREYILDNY